MIPRRIILYWSAKKMSYLRYLCLKSLLRFHWDNWEIILFHDAPDDAVKTWEGDINQDFHNYDGVDYFPGLGRLGMNLVRLRPRTTPIHSSDTFRFEQLDWRGGIYIDTDMLFTGPIDDLYEQFCESEAAITFTRSQGFQIGFLAGARDSGFLKTLSKTSKENRNTAAYQSCGTDALYKMLDPDCDVRSSAKILRGNYDAVLQDRFPNVHIIPSETLYPYHCGQVPEIFEGRDRVVPPYSVHLFGGHPLFQKYNNLVTEENIDDYDGFIFWLIRELELA